ncbi:hypothetical protein [Polluticoccus soli]|uniref:hypothetical protein n=1 Tax=Polluticoccus soli TaxID=3034150 RepID=UPI0023E26901|nr:hypothetical protein [Flavipsychrobacter sp. JY13-12]
MKLTQLIFPALIMVSLASCDGCKRDNDINVPGGKGGTGILRITLQHHDRILDTAGIVYMAYGMEAPGDGKYADSVKCINENGQHVAIFNNLRKGEYYLYGKGFDSKAGAMIAGGNGYLLREEKTVDYVLSVSTHL